MKLFTFCGFRFLRYHNESKEHPEFSLWYFSHKQKCFFLYFLSCLTNNKSLQFAISFYNYQIEYFDSKRNLLITLLDNLAMNNFFYQNTLLYSLFRFTLDRFLRKFCFNYIIRNFNLCFYVNAWIHMIWKNKWH